VRKSQSGQVMVLVALSLIALIGSAALVLLAGSAEWQKNQLQQVADQAALDAAMKIGIGCDAGKANIVITAADDAIAAQRTRSGALNIPAATCATPYTGKDNFSSGTLSATINYPYSGHQQQVEVVLTLTLPLSFGGVVGKTSTTLVRRAVAQALPGSVPALSATSLSCTGGQVNVAGSIAAQNAIALSGSCALYAHTRFDAASGTYSDLGNASVYTDGQTWIGAGGSCAAGGNSGSTNAVCADGYELTGHATPACGTTSAFLSVGGAAVNPNPCAAGVARPPVAPVSTSLPPEPNADPAIYAKLPGGAPCNPAGTYPPIVVNGVTVGYGPAPTKDLSGYYHFQASCYGYLNVGPLSTGISNVQFGPVVTAQHFITPTFPAPTTAGTLLVADVRSDATPNRFIAPAGWVEAGVPSQAGTSPRTEIWYLPGNLNPGGVPNPMFTITPANIDSTAQVSEWRNVAAVNPLDQTGNFSTGANQLNATVATGGATAAANELVITADGVLEGQAGQAVTNPAGWNSLANDPTDGFSSEYRLDLPAAVASETVNASVTTSWALVIAAFKAGGGGLGAVLDPGFYYFNGYDGSGFATGGGICLNGGTLLARDTTLEFVNKSGFSSGDCTPGGGGSACTGPCQFGSTPCSVSACPPNAVADPGAITGSNQTWFAAPCGQAPAGDASCPASAWCPAGDRACSNVLIWAPAGTNGQFAIKGASAKHWLLGSVYWPGTCTDTVNGTSTIAGTLLCGSLSISAGAGAATAIGGNYGIGTALVEAILVE
jgi:Putative Flp pilus-assembly TadE/G-like